MTRLAGRGGPRAGEVDASGEPSPERIRQAGPTSNTTAVAEMRGRVVRDVGHRRAEHDVEHEQVLDDLAREPERARELGR